MLRRAALALAHNMGAKGRGHAQNVDVYCERALEQRGNAFLNKRAKLAGKQGLGYGKVDIGREKRGDGGVWKENGGIDADGRGVGRAAGLRQPPDNC